MRAWAMKALLGAGVIAGCLGATYAAATLALQRPGTFRIDAALASRLQADYSTDDYSLDARPPLDPGVIDAARTDEQAGDGADAPQPGTAPAAPVEPAATVAPQPAAASPVVPISSSTPPPAAVNTPTPRPEPSDTPEPRPSATPIPSATMTPKPVTCGVPVPGLDGGGSEKCRSATHTPTTTSTPTVVPPTPTRTPTATPRPILGCLIPSLPLLGGGDKCNTHTPTPSP